MVRSEDSFIEEEVGLATLEFTLADRLNACVADMEPGSPGWLCISWREVWVSGNTWNIWNKLLFYWLSWPVTPTLRCKSVGWGFRALRSYFYIGCVMTWPHRSTVLYDTVQTVQNLSFSFSHVLFQNNFFFSTQTKTMIKQWYIYK